MMGLFCKLANRFGVAESPWCGPLAGPKRRQGVARMGKTFPIYPW